MSQKYVGFTLHDYFCFSYFGSLTKLLGEKNLHKLFFDLAFGHIFHN